MFAHVEQLFIELYEQGKTIREFAKEVHISFRDLGTIIRTAGEELDPRPKRNNFLKDSQAIENVPGSLECWTNGFDDGVNDSYHEDRANECADIPGNQYQRAFDLAIDIMGSQMMTEETVRS